MSIFGLYFLYYNLTKFYYIFAWIITRYFKVYFFSLFLLLLYFFNIFQTFIRLFVYFMQFYCIKFHFFIQIFWFFCYSSWWHHSLHSVFLHKVYFYVLGEHRLFLSNCFMHFRIFYLIQPKINPYYIWVVYTYL